MQCLPKLSGESNTAPKTWANIQTTDYLGLELFLLFSDILDWEQGQHQEFPQGPPFIDFGQEIQQDTFRKEAPSFMQTRKLFHM